MLTALALVGEQSLCRDLGILRPRVVRRQELRYLELWFKQQQGLGGLSCTDACE